MCRWAAGRPRATAPSRSGMTRFGWLAIVGMLLACHLAVPAGTTAAGGWSEPVKLSGDTIWPWFPDIAAGSDGRVHVVWNGGGNRGDRNEVGALYYTTTSDRTSWSRPNDIALIWQGHALRSSIAADAAGRVHLVYKGLGELGPEALTRRVLGEEDLWHMTAAGAEADQISSWSTTMKVNLGTVGYFSDLAIDSRGVLHTVFTEVEAGRWDIYYRRSTDGGATWSRRIALDGVHFVWWYRAQLKIDAWDRLHVVWEMTDMTNLGRTLGAAYAVSTDGGDSWRVSRWQRLTPDLTDGGRGHPPLPGPQQPSIGVDGWGRVLLVFRDPESDRIVFQLSHNGIDWSEPSPLPGISRGIRRPYDVYDMVTDSAGRVHLAVVGYPTGSDWLGLLHSVWDGQGWSMPAVVTAAPPVPEYAAYASAAQDDSQALPLLSPPYPEYPRLAVSRGNRLHLVWFGGDRPSVDRVAVGIWYSTLLTEAPEQAPPSTAMASPARPPRRAAAQPLLRPPPAAVQPLPVVPPASVSGATGEMPSVTYRQWQVVPLLMAGVAVVPVLAVILLVRLRSFHRTGG